MNRAHPAGPSGRRVQGPQRPRIALAEALFRHWNQVLSREQLLSQVCGFDFDPGSNVVDVYIRYLRKKFGPERI